MDEKPKGGSGSLILALWILAAVIGTIATVLWMAISKNPPAPPSSAATNAVAR